MTRKISPAIFCVIALAAIFKLTLAWLTVGTNDVTTWQSFAVTAQKCGVCVYDIPGPYGDPFNHPPFIIHFLKLLPVSDLFPFWLRLPSIAADVFAFYLVNRLSPDLSGGTLALLALNPVSILISGFHGNTDPVMIAFLLAAILLTTNGKVGLAGLAFGMALNVKVVPLLFAPCFLIYLTTMKQRALFCLSAIALVVLLSLPYLVETTDIVKSVLGYRGLFTNWGIAHYADLAGLEPMNALAKPFQYLLFSVCAIVPWFLRRRGVSLFTACGFVVLAFYTLTPSLALQYLAWGVPFVVVFGFRWAGLYYALAGALIALQYHRWSGGRWIFADSHSVLPVTAETELLSLSLWVTCCALLWVIVHQPLLNTNQRKMIN